MTHVIHHLVDKIVDVDPSMVKEYAPVYQVILEVRLHADQSVSLVQIVLEIKHAVTKDALILAKELVACVQNVKLSIIILSAAALQDSLVLRSQYAKQ